MSDWLLDKIKAYSKTPQGEKKIKAALATNSSNGVEDATIYGDKFIEILKEEVASILSRTTGDAFLSYFDPIKIIVDKATGMCEVQINFDKTMTHRDSLYPSKYPEGVELQYLFSTGYRAKNYAYGIDRHGRKIRSKRKRKGINYMQRARSKFNAIFAAQGVKATYSFNFRNGDYPQSS